MHLSIFGVGRSGTKAIQLYLSYLIALREGRVWINYEPYFWLDRKTHLINYEGFLHHYTTPQLMTHADCFSKTHLTFLNKLKAPNSSIVTKSIRSNGRIEKLTEVFEPDHTIIVIRDLYPVLKSLSKTQWDFWAYEWGFSHSWERFTEEIRRNFPMDNFDWCLEQIKNQADRNAFYWYVMNLAALRAVVPNSFLVEYGNIKEVDIIARRIFKDIPDEETIDQPFFNGDNLHNDFPLHSAPRNHRLTNSLNTFFQKSGLLSRLGLYLPYENIGSEAALNRHEDVFYEEGNEVSIRRFSVEKKDFYEYCIEDINKRISFFKKRNQVTASAAS